MKDVRVGDGGEKESMQVERCMYLHICRLNEKVPIQTSTHTRTHVHTHTCVCVCMHTMRYRKHESDSFIFIYTRIHTRVTSFSRATV